MKGNRKFNNAQAGTKMPAIYRNVIDNKLPELFAKLNKLCLVELFKVSRAIDFL
jgi:hypothetical protein